MRLRTLKGVYLNSGPRKTNPSARKLRAKTKGSEANLLRQVKAILEILKQQGLIAYRRIHVMPVFRGGKMSANPEQAGMEDLQVYLMNGRVLFWELKSLTGKQSEHQKKRQEELTSLGHKYTVIRSLDQAISELSAQGLNLIAMGDPSWSE